MRIDTFISVRRPGLFVSIQSGRALESVALPASPAGLVPLREHRMNWDAEDPLPRISMHASEIVQEIEQNGYAIHRVDITSRSYL